MEHQPYDMLALNESKLDENDSDQMLSLNGYTIVRRDRDKRGGWICVYVRGAISFKRLYELEDENLELIPLEIQNLTQSLSFSLRDTDHRKQTLNLLGILSYFWRKTEEIYVVGDLNCYFPIESPLSFTLHNLGMC